MNFLQPTIEAKLSAALGAEVKFGQMKLSLRSRKFIAENMTVAGESPDRPMLTVRRISAQLSAAKALLGQISIKEVLIEGPQLLLTRKFRPPPPGRGSGKFEARTIRVEQATVAFQKDSRVVSAEQISAAITRHAGDIEFNATIGQFAGLGAAEIVGTFAAEDWSMIPHSAASAELRFADGLTLSLKSPRLADWQLAIAVTGSVDLQKFLAVLPFQLPLPFPLSSLPKIGLTADITLLPPARQGIT
jgi:uncharacterized protein involved in outer membrane biogenesis